MWSRNVEEKVSGATTLRLSHSAGAGGLPQPLRTRRFEFGWERKQVENWILLGLWSVSALRACQSLASPAYLPLLSAYSPCQASCKLRCAQGFHNSTTTARSMRRCQWTCIAMLLKETTDRPCELQSDEDVTSRTSEKLLLRNDCPVQMAERIRKDNVNILIDLTGYTMNMQTEVFAIGPSPIQDYAGYYTERLVLLPNTYLTNDHRQSRREVLERVYLNGDDPVHGPKSRRCSTFGCESCEEFPGKSGRVLLSLPASQHASLALIFKEREFRVKGLADFFLDTPLFNAHTTAGTSLDLFCFRSFMHACASLASLLPALRVAQATCFGVEFPSSRCRVS
eukprot:757768-Hanusia_phi.AAC.6